MKAIRRWRPATLAGLCALGVMVSMGQGAAAQAQASASASASASAASAPTAASLAKLSIADFFRDPELRQPKLSPDGRSVALLVTASEESGRSALAVMSLDPGHPVRVVASFADADIGRFDWVGSGRLVYSSARNQAGDRGRDSDGAGLWVVKPDGSDRRQLIQTLYNPQRSRNDPSAGALSSDWVLMSVPDDESSEVIVAYGRYGSRLHLESVQLARLDVDTRRRRTLEVDVPDRADSWWIDAAGNPWAMSTSKGNQTALYFKTAAGWTLAQEGDTVDNVLDSPIGSDGKDLRLVVRKSPAGMEALYRIDPKTLKPEAQPLVGLAGFDFDGRAVFDTDSRRLLGLQYESDAPGVHWFDPTLKAMQAAVDQALPGRVNILSCQRCLKTGRVMVTSMSDRMPSEYFLYDHADKQLQSIGLQRPWIREQDMAPREPFRIRARDGLEFPVMVTRPLASAYPGPRPAVMLVHGGPYVRGTSWWWSALPQFLASRGYVVIEPEFRGSTGYGEMLFKAGWRQWGLAMQDDVSDAMAWAVKQGWVDGKRVCIAGASYGGYATVMGLVKDPDQYRCGITWAGVTDIDYLYSIDWSDTSDTWKRYGMTVMIGDRKKDAEQLRRTSPLRRAAEIRVPVLIAHGQEDVRVPLDHAADFHRALIRAGHRDNDYVVYNEEGHGWRKLSTKLDFYGRMERFLAKHLAADGARAP